MSLINEGRIHLSVDIESTAGPSLLAELGKIYDQDHVLVYDFQTDRLARISDLPGSPIRALLEKGREVFQNTPLISLLDQLSRSGPRKVHPNLEWFEVEEIPPDTAAIHGRFRPDRFESEIENPFISTVLRDPLERAVAQYVEWKRRKGAVQWRVHIPYRKELTFREFAFRKELKNFQFKSLGDKRLGDFDLVGITECLEGFIMQLHGEEPKKNAPKSTQPGIRASKYNKLGITDDLKAEFREYNLKDYDLYLLAKEFMGYCD